jgi:ABC-type uncharacterized transport system fused permease/ATPase subunit
MRSGALYRGEAIELGSFQERFRNVCENFWQIMKRQKRLTWFTSGYAQAGLIFSRRRRTALFCQANRIGWSDAGGQRVYLGSEFAFFHP